MKDQILLLSNCGSEEEALRIARHLVERQVAACVNVLPAVRSVYRWKGAVEEATEWTLLIKSRADLFDRVRDELCSVHSYEVPELIAVPIVAGLQAYLNWIDESTAQAG